MVAALLSRSASVGDKMNHFRILALAALIVPLSGAGWNPVGTEVRSIYWGAAALSADATECADAAEVTINSGPKLFAIDCPMGTAETDGFVYGNVVLPDSFDKTSDVTFELTTYVQDDQGAQTWYGVVAIQCQPHQGTIDSTWGTGISLDVDAEAGDVANDVLQDTSAAVDTDDTGESCDGGETLFWRWKSCDTDATPSAGCTSSAGAEADFGILGVKMEYTSLIGD